MHRPRENNPHFFSLELPPIQDQQTQPQHGPTRQFPRGVPPGERPQHKYQQSQPHHEERLQHKYQQSQPHHDSSPPIPTQQQTPSPRTPDPIIEHPDQRGHPHYHRHHLPRHQTNPVGWLLAAFCALFWITVIVGGLAVLIIYLVFKPRSPKFDIANASLNAAYIDMGYLLNSHLTLLVNFSNPNKKVSVDFNSVVMNLYFEGNLIAARFVEPFSAMSGQSKFGVVPLVTSQAQLSLAQSQDFERQIVSGRLMFQVKGAFRAKSRLDGILRYSYWLHSHCNILVSSPPNSALIAHNCVTKQ